MIVSIGRNKLSGFPVSWTTDAINPHCMVVGVTGSGKTFRLRHIIEQLQRFNARLHVFDAHGDLFISNSAASVTKFSETSEVGINPFIVNPDLEYGGIRRKVASFISMVNRYSTRSLGDRQEAVLRNILYEFYKEYGYEHDKPHTWQSDGKRIPTLQDFKSFIYDKIGTLLLGAPDNTFGRQDEVNERISTLQEALRQPDVDPEYIETLRKDCKEAFSNYIDSMEACIQSMESSEGKALREYIMYASKEVLKSVYHRIDTLNATGIFKNNPPRFNLRKPVWLYDIKSLSDGEAGFVVETYLEKIFASAKQRGIVNEVDTFVVIDEATKYFCKEADHILNVGVRESRKFGLGFLFAGQRFAHFPEDIAAMCATKIILGVDESEHGTVARRLGIKEARLKYIKHKRTALVQIKGSGDTANNNFVETLL